MQVAHDVLAARWRHLVRPPQGDLFVAGDVTMADWLGWLEAEIDDWAGDPHLVAAFRRIVSHQNAVLVYAAEDTLRRRLMARHDAVPWTQGTADRRTW